MDIEIGNKKYKVQIAKTEEEKTKGLQGVTNLPKDEGMLFMYDEPQTVGFWMKDTLIPLDIIFIDEDQEVISVYQGEPESDAIAEEDNVKYVLEVNINSGITEGDELDFEEEDTPPVMKVLGSNGEALYELWGSERIFSRPNTKTLIRMAKKADLTKSDSDYKRLGNKMFKYIEQLDTRKPEYVTTKSSKED